MKALFLIVPVTTVAGLFSYAASAENQLESTEKKTTLQFETCTLFGEKLAATVTRFGYVPASRRAVSWRIVTVTCGTETHTDFGRESALTTAGPVSCEGLLAWTQVNPDSLLSRETLRRCHGLQEFPVDDATLLPSLIEAETSPVPNLDTHAAIGSFALAHSRREFPKRRTAAETVRFEPETARASAKCLMRSGVDEATVQLGAGIMRVRELQCARRRSERYVNFEPFTHLHFGLEAADVVSAEACPTRLDVAMLCATVADLHQVPHYGVVEDHPEEKHEICELRGAEQTIVRLQRPFSLSEPVRWILDSVACGREWLGDFDTVNASTVDPASKLGGILRDIERRFNHYYSNGNLARINDFAHPGSLSRYALLPPERPGYCNALRLYFDSRISFNQICDLLLH